MDQLYIRYKTDIIKLFTNHDIPYILKPPLISKFDNSSLDKIAQADINDKVEIFFQEFDKILSNSKYLDFVDVTKGVSDWISELIMSKIQGQYAYSKLNSVCDLINVNPDFYVDNLTFDENVIKKCLEENLISQPSYDLLLDTLNEDGVVIAKNRFLNIVHVKSYNCYSKFLYISYKYNKTFVEIFCESLYSMLEDVTSDQDLRNIIQMYCNSLTEGDFAGGQSPDSSASDEFFGPKTMTYESIFRTNSLDIFPNSLAVIDNKSYDESSSVCDDDSLDFDDIFGEVKNTNVKEMLNFHPEFKLPELEMFRVREYQQELADYGIAGNNVLICAPTGSGKTVVAIKIVGEHFKNNPSAKVIFIVPTNLLVEQQYRKFQKHLGIYQIVQQSGSSKPASAPFSFLIPSHDIFIVTCDILKNMLESNEYPKRSLSDFTMVIFDECHHCLKGHSYNKVMDYYFELKTSGNERPQIIGMTASTGTDKAKSMEAAMISLYNLCANLDCRIVATVKVNERNLTESLNCAVEEIRLPGRRENDMFELELLQLFSKIEHRLLDLYGNQTNQISIPQDRWHDKYLQFASILSKSNLNMMSDEADKEIRSIAQCLMTFHRALLVNNLFSKQYARVMIKELVTECPVNFERNIQNQLRSFLSNDNQLQDANPSLECLKNEIKTQFELDTKSRIIVFVKEIKYAKFMAEELNNANIDNARCAHFVGTNKSAEQGGCTSSTVNEVLKKFEAGKINVICCTSKPEEGLDIETCNLVVRYGYVTNEISRIQSKGRARAKNSKYLVIVPYRMEWQTKKESVNKFRETMMYRAIEQFQNTDESINANKIDDVQLRRRFDKSVVLSNDCEQTSDKIWDICCSKCEAYLCESSDIRVVNGNSYVVINKHIFHNMPVKEFLPNSSKITCVCLFEIGILQKHSGVLLPVLQIKKILFKSGPEKVQVKVWKEAPFRPLDVEYSEIRNADSDFYHN